MANSKRKSFALRIDPELWKDIEAWAHQEFRSVNSQIEFLLKEAVRKRKNSSPAEKQTSDDKNKES